jgi:hypothetical protein
MTEEIPLPIAIPLILIAWAVWLGPSTARAVSSFYARGTNQTDGSE